VTIIDRIRNTLFGPPPPTTRRIQDEELSWVTDLEKDVPRRRRLLSLYVIEGEHGPIMTIRFPCGRRNMLQTTRPPDRQDMTRDKLRKITRDPG
jgi:hypothetical protein